MELPHIGFTVTKKIGNAVTRNRIRRRLRAVMDEIAKEDKLPKARVAITARHEALTKEFPEMIRDMKWALRKIAERNREAKTDADA